jgi:hypothetical protein
MAYWGVTIFRPFAAPAVALSIASGQRAKST